MKSKTTNIAPLITCFREKGPIILLESQMPTHPASKISYLAAEPEAWIKSRGNQVEIMEKGKVSTFKQNPWKAITDFRNKHKDWMFGYFGYDLKNYVEDLTSNNREIAEAADLFFMIPKVLISWNQNREIDVIKGEFPDETQINQDQFNNEIQIQLTNSISKSEYISRIEKAKRDIYEGEYYEINLSHSLEFNFDGDPWNLYQAMKAEGPVPFAAYLETGDLTICSSSPERFLSKSGNRVWSQPIKGTALRNRTSDRDEAVEALKKSEKERAENLMIVDLVRNDLGRIAKNKSVKVTNLFEIQSFETVHQMVSTVECEVGEKADSIDIIKACFPMGSMTGAPKIAAMHAIEKYENYKRGVYSGAVGYLKPSADFDFNVVIRTALIKGNNLVYPVGGAITSDSDPEAEWEETLIKARAITNISNDLKKAE